MRKISKKKLVVGVAAAGLIAAGAGTAFAYWSTSGTGSGTASTGSVNGIAINQATPTASLYPGGHVDLAGTFDNANSGAVKVGSVSATSVTVDSVHAADGCLSSDYTVTGSAPVNAEVPVGSGVGTWSGLVLNMADTSSDQNACKGATVTVQYTSN